MSNSCNDDLIWNDRLIRYKEMKDNMISSGKLDFYHLLLYTYADPDYRLVITYDGHDVENIGELFEFTEDQVKRATVSVYRKGDDLPFVALQ